ncbi:MAG TPA: gephyrin-like molybdotransferase Glp [Syntrophomonadaceae bacterium]|nr:gephyrin-like molybdotransferase Glp [Syntrophomonadaceae bacterium]
MREFFKVVNYQEAREQVRQHFPSRMSEVVALEQACNRVLAVPVQSPEPLPAFHRSTVDGYAIQAQDSFGSSESIPAFFTLVGEVPMGEVPGFDLLPGQCAWIPTGGMLPPGSNAAVMVEYTEKLGEDTILVYRPVSLWENVMQRGEDIQTGQFLYEAGFRLRAQDIGLLASLGFTSLEVYRPYRVGIISTGDEIVEVESHPAIGQVRDVNSASLTAAVQTTGNLPCTYPIVRDDFGLLKATLEMALRENDLVLMSGGSSVGIKDVTLDVLQDLPDSELLFHGIAVKPGKPTLAVRVGRKLVVGLPGHPVSALMIFLIICRPVLGFAGTGFQEALCSENIASQPGRDDFIPVQLTNRGDAWTAQPLLGKSGLMSILSRADAFIHIGYEQQGVLQGQTVTAILF